MSVFTLNASRRVGRQTRAWLREANEARYSEMLVRQEQGAKIIPVMLPAPRRARMLRQAIRKTTSAGAPGETTTSSSSWIIARLDRGRSQRDKLEPATGTRFAATHRNPAFVADQRTTVFPEHVNQLTRDGM